MTSQALPKRRTNHAQATLTTEQTRRSGVSYNSARNEGGADCCVSQVGDREWWCATHQRNAEGCEVDA